MHDCDGEPLGCEGWTDPLLLASFIHLHFGQEQELAGRLVAAARASIEARRDGHGADGARDPIHRPGVGLGRDVPGPFHDR